MAYTEPYPVITQWPGTENHNPGIKRCFHYSLTLEQVIANRNTIYNNLSKSNIAVTAFLDGLGILSLAGTIIHGAGVSLITILDQIGSSNERQVQETLYRIWDTIRLHMLEHGYKRVTISQVIELTRQPSPNIYENPMPIKVWLPLGYPRVPLESYYLKN